MLWIYRDFPRFFSKMHLDFADFYRDFLTALMMTDDDYNDYDDDMCLVWQNAL